MAKKSRKARSRSRVVETARQPDARPAQQKAQPASAKAQLNAAVAIQPQNYDYVKSDLVRIAVIAGILILVLIILTFVPALKA
jgi:predicted RND superfamily exporter protein